MNYIVLEGAYLCIFLILIILLLLISLGSLICAILLDKRNFMLKSLLSKSGDRLRLLAKENFILKLRCGDFNIDEK